MAKIQGIDEIMEDQANKEANSEAQSAVSGRRPGRPKGLPRPAGSGRKKGTPNRATRDLREAAQKYTVKALKELAGMLSDPDPKVKLGAIREILDRGHGKPVAPSELTGRDGAPLLPAGDIDVARRLAFVLTKGAMAGDRQAGEMVEQDRAERIAREADEPSTWHTTATPPPEPSPATDVPERTAEATAAIAKREADMELTRKTDAIIAQSRAQMGGPRVVRLRPRE